MLLSGTGLQGIYKSADGTLAANQVDQTIAFDWDTARPAAITTEAFTAEWFGQVEADATASHTFYVNADGGTRLRVNGQLLIDEWHSASTVDATASVDLIAGRRYDIELSYKEDSESAAVRLEWESAGQKRQTVPTSNLFPSARGTATVDTFEAFTDSITELSAASVAAVATETQTVSSLEIQDDNGNGAGRRLSGYLHVPETGAYRLFIASDAAAELRLSPSDDSDNARKIAEIAEGTTLQNWIAEPGQQSNAMYLAAGQSYFIEALSIGDGNHDHVSVGILRPGTTSVELVSGELLSPVRPTVEAFADLPSISENSNQPATFTVARNGAASANDLVVNYVVRGSATAGTDYVSLPGSITIPAGQINRDCRRESATGFRARRYRINYRRTAFCQQLRCGTQESTHGKHPVAGQRRSSSRRNGALVIPVAGELDLLRRQLL